MRRPRLSSTHIVAAALTIAGALAPMPVMAQAQPPAQPPAQAPAPVLGPYKHEPITLPPAVNDPTFGTFRIQLAEIAKNTERAELARITASKSSRETADKHIPAKHNTAITIMR